MEEELQSHQTSDSLWKNPRTKEKSLSPKEAVFSEQGESDALIIQEVLKGKQERFRVIVERYERKVFGIAMNYLRRDRERAADAAQEIFFKVYRGLAGFQSQAKFSTWVHQIALNHCISERRKDNALKRGRPLSLDAPLGPEHEKDMHAFVGNERDEPTRKLGAEERKLFILDAIDSLDDDLRAVVTLCDLQEQSYEETAEILSIPIGTVRSRLHRARAVLQEKLKDLL